VRASYHVQARRTRQTLVQEIIYSKRFNSLVLIAAKIGSTDKYEHTGKVVKLNICLTPMTSIAFSCLYCAKGFFITAIQHCLTQFSYAFLNNKS
jgi:hypothetical protein